MDDRHLDFEGLSDVVHHALGDTAPTEDLPGASTSHTSGRAPQRPRPGNSALPFEGLDALFDALTLGQRGLGQSPSGPRPPRTVLVPSSEARAEAPPLAPSRSLEDTQESDPPAQVRASRPSPETLRRAVQALGARRLIIVPRVEVRERDGPSPGLLVGTAVFLMLGGALIWALVDHWAGRPDDTWRPARSQEQRSR